MSDLKERFQSLDRVPAPDLWRDISRREPADVSLGPQWRRVAVAALAFVIAATGMGIATWAFVVSRDTRRVDRPPIAANGNGKIAFVGGKGQPFTIGLSDARIYDMDPDGSSIHFLAKGKEPAWSPDGTRIAYVKGGEFPWYELHVLDLLGKRNARILLNKTQFIQGPSWSPDSQRMVVAIGGSNKGYDLFILNADGSGLHRITSVSGSVGYPDWSPDGSRIVFTASDRPNSGLMNIYVVGADGTNLHRVTQTSHFQFSPVWSPDGGRIAFVDSQGQDNPSSINVMNADGTAEHSLFTCTQCLMDVAWSPDGNKLLFSKSQRSAWHIGTMRTDGTSLSQIDTGPFQAFMAAWQPIPETAAPASPTALPSGTHSPAGIGGDFAYQIGFGPDAQIWVMHSDGSGAHLLIPGTDPAWAPDGSRVAFRTNFVGDRNDVAVIDADGSNKYVVASSVRYTQDAGWGGAPSWSPDGSAIVFAGQEGLLVVDASTDTPRLLTHLANCVEYDPTWSPDGQQIAFGVGCTEALFDTQAGIVAVNADGTNRHRIVGPEDLAQFPPTNPGWSPDGRHLGFSTAGEAGGTIYIADADGSNVFALTDGFEPCWSPDGSKIAFTSQDVRDEDRDIYVIGIDGSGRKRITSDRAVEWNPAWQP